VTNSDWLSKAVREKFPEGVESLSPVSQAELLRLLLSRAQYKGPRGEEGKRGIQGLKGDKGDAPRHEWDGTKLRFQNPDDTWGAWVDLVGDEPAHEWQGTKLRFQNPDGTWGAWVDLEGMQGLPPEHQWLGTKLRFKHPNGEWSDWRDLLGKAGRDGDKGDKGDKGAKGDKGDKGKDGKDGKDGKHARDGKDGGKGEQGPPPKHEVRNRRIRFQQPNGTWGPWIDLGALNVVFPAGVEQIGAFWRFIETDFSEKPTYLPNGSIDFVEIFEGPTQEPPNLRARMDMTYDENFDPATETWKIFSPLDAISILRTKIFTYTFVNGALTKVVELTV
jgi:hypothetical protein